MSKNAVKYTQSIISYEQRLDALRLLAMEVTTEKLTFNRDGVLVLPEGDNRNQYTPISKAMRDAVYSCENGKNPAVRMRFMRDLRAIGLPPAQKGSKSKTTGKKPTKSAILADLKQDLQKYIRKGLTPADIRKVLGTIA